MIPELRKDLVSGDWIVISPNRKKRPEQFKRSEKTKKVLKKDCRFEDLKKINPEGPILIYPLTYEVGAGIYGAKKWQLAVIENKYPAFSHKKMLCPVLDKCGPYQTLKAIGHHELVVTRNHNNNFPKLSENEARQVFQAFRDRYLMFLTDKCVEYVSIFHNWGAKAGASVYHPHYQIIAMPVVPPDVSHSLKGSDSYFKEHKKCVHCVMIDWEIKNKNRVIFENEGAIAFAPFVSREPFEIRIFPKKHLPYFENTLDSDMNYVVDALKMSLKKLEKNLKNPDYNFFLHTSPIQNKEKHSHYHWHIEIIPKTTIKAGFELGTGMEINIVDPNEAARILRK